MTDFEAWEQREDESAQAFAAFRTYRDMEPSDRSIQRAKELAEGKPVTNFRSWQRWSSTHEWRKRVRAWDQHCDRQRQRTQLKAIEKMRDEHIRIARVMQTVGSEGLARYWRQMQTDPDFVPAPGLSMQLFQQGSAIERLSRGEPTEVINSLADNRVIEIVWTDDEPEESDDDDADRGQDAEAPQGSAEDSTK